MIFYLNRPMDRGPYRNCARGNRISHRDHCSSGNKRNNAPGFADGLEMVGKASAGVLANTPAFVPYGTAQHENIQFDDSLHGSETLPTRQNGTVLKRCH